MLPWTPRGEEWRAEGGTVESAGQGSCDIKRDLLTTAGLTINAMSGSSEQVDTIV
jgi:hypothetical protein